MLMTLIYYACYYVNAVLKHLVNWLNAHKISINIKKTEMVTFTSKKNKFEGDLKTGERLYYPTEIVNYLGVKITRNIRW